MESATYSTGRPCKNGHNAERFVSNRTCVECVRECKRRYRQHPLHSTWKMMVERCHSPGSYGYYKYGAKGIKVCQRWRKFGNFVEDMGVRPGGHTLDRINPKGNYEPANCRWASLVDQANNKTNTRYVDVGGSLVPRSIAAREAGINEKAFITRITKLGWSVNEALSYGSGKRKDRHRNSIKTHCKYGHPLSGENLYVRPQGRRECKQCVRARNRRYNGVG